VNNDCLEVDKLILEIADYKNDYADMAAERFLKKCSISRGDMPISKDHTDLYLFNKG